MFCVALHVSGRFFAVVVVPSPFGPRQAGQLAARAPGRAPHITSSATPADLAETERRELGTRGRGFMAAGAAKSANASRAQRKTRRIALHLPAAAILVASE